MKINDEYFMKKTFGLARLAQGDTSPNPMVGAVIVKNNKIISTGYHRKAGLPHAEAEAIDRASTSLKGATLYLNLEPCYHFGRTPPCVDKIIASGISRVVYAVNDPNPLVSGRSLKKLRQSGISVTKGVCETQARQLNEIFFTNMVFKRPFVALKLAQSIDGKIATRTRQSRWITSEKSRLFSRTLRDKYDAVLVGAGTIRTDNPRLSGKKRDPYKIIIDPFLSMSPTSSVFDEHPEKVIIAYGRSSARNVKRFAQKGVLLLKMPMHKKYFSLKTLLSRIYRRYITSVFVEGGAFTAGRFIDECLVDKIYFFIAPLIIGGEQSLSSVGALGARTIKQALPVENITIKKIDRDYLLTADVKKK